MNREEIEHTLLTTGTVAINSDGGQRIVLNGHVARQLAQVVVDRLQSSTVTDLSNDRDFFEALEKVFVESSDDMERTAQTSDEGGEPVADSDRRAWRL